jgi:hypothetical protein
MEAVIKAEPIEAKLRRAAKEGKLPQRTDAERRVAAAKLGIVSPAEIDHLAYTDRLRHDVIKVDDFDHDLARESARQEETWQSTDSKKRAVAASL